MNAPEELAIEKRRGEVWDLQVLGWGYRAIAEHLGVSIGTVASDMKALVEMARAENAEKVERERMLSISRNGKALRVVMPQLDDPDKVKDAVDSLVKLEKRRADLLGLDSATKVEATVASVSLDELSEIRRAAEANECSSSDPQKPNDGSAPSS